MCVRCDARHGHTQPQFNELPTTKVSPMTKFINMFSVMIDDIVEMNVSHSKVIYANLFVLASSHVYIYIICIYIYSVKYYYCDESSLLFSHSI